MANTNHSWYCTIPLACAFIKKKATNHLSASKRHPLFATDYFTPKSDFTTTKSPLELNLSMGTNQHRKSALACLYICQAKNENDTTTYSQPRRSLCLNKSLSVKRTVRIEAHQKAKKHTLTSVNNTS